MRDLGEAPVPARFNSARLEQVLVNLLENAFRYTPADGTVTVRLRPADGNAELVVEDSGVAVLLTHRSLARPARSAAGRPPLYP